MPPTAGTPIEVPAAPRLNVPLLSVAGTGALPAPLAPRGLHGAVVIEGGVTRPEEVGVAERNAQKADFRAFMRKAGLGRSRANADE